MSTYLTINIFLIPISWFTITATKAFVVIPVTSQSLCSDLWEVFTHISSQCIWFHPRNRDVHVGDEIMFVLQEYSRKLVILLLLLFRAIWSHIGGWFRWLDTATIIRLCYPSSWWSCCIFVVFTVFVCLTGSWSCHLCLALLKDKASIYQQNQNSAPEWHQSHLRLLNTAPHHQQWKTLDLLSVWSSRLRPHVAESDGRSAPTYLSIVGGEGITTNLPAKSLRLAVIIHNDHTHSRLSQLDRLHGNSREEED